MMEVAQPDRVGRAVLVDELLAFGVHQQFPALQVTNHYRMGNHSILLDVRSLIAASPAIPPGMSPSCTRRACGTSNRGCIWRLGSGSRSTTQVVDRSFGTAASRGQARPWVWAKATAAGREGNS